MGTEQILIDDIRPTEQADLDRKDKQSIEDKRDTKSIVEEGSIIMEKVFQHNNEPTNLVEEIQHENETLLIDDIVSTAEKQIKTSSLPAFGSFTVNYTGPEGKPLEFTIQPRKIRNKTPDETSIIIKEEIKKQMVKIGVDINKIVSTEKKDEKESQIKIIQIEKEDEKIPQKKEIQKEDTEDKVSRKQVQVEELSIEKMKESDKQGIEKDDQIMLLSEDGKQVLKRTEQILIDDKRPTEQADLDRKDKQSIEDKLDAKSIVEEEGVIIEKVFQQNKEPTELVEEIQHEKETLLIDDIVSTAEKQIKTSSLPAFGSFTVNYTGPEGKPLEFTIQPRKIRNKTPDETSIIIKEEIKKQMVKIGVDINKIVSTEKKDEKESQIKTIQIEKEDEKIPQKKEIQKEDTEDKVSRKQVQVEELSIEKMKESDKQGIEKDDQIMLLSEDGK